MKLFVAKLNRETTEEDLKENFSQFGGVVSVKVVSDRDTGQSKCFGFIEMDSSEAGEAAIANQNGEEFMGFRMVVKQAEDKPRSPRPSHGGHSQSGDNRRSGDSGRSSGHSASGDRSNQGGFSSPGSNSSSNSSSPGSKTTSGSAKKRIPPKRGKGGPDKYADGARTTQHAKRPKSNRNQWLDDLDDF